MPPGHAPATAASSGNADGLSEELAARWQHLVVEVRRRLGTGARLESDTRRSFETLIGQGIDQVLVHRSPFAGSLADVSRAEALTLGQHVLGASERLDGGTS